MITSLCFPSAVAAPAQPATTDRVRHTINVFNFMVGPLAVELMRKSMITPKAIARESGGTSWKNKILRRHRVRQPDVIGAFVKDDACTMHITRAHFQQDKPPVARADRRGGLARKREVNVMAFPL